jgi:thiosulfate reductase / polysulfide reductase chain A
VGFSLYGSWFRPQYERTFKSFGKGANDTQLITNVMIDPLMGGTGMRGNFVTFTASEPTKEMEVNV